MSKPTSKQYTYFSWVASQGCLVCRGEALIHHITHEHCHDAPEVRITRNHDKVVPLCHYHHVDSKVGIHGIGSQWGFYLMTKELYGEGINLVEEAQRLFDKYESIK